MSEPADQSDPIAAAVRRIIEELGEDPARPGLEDTPERVAAAFRFLTRGYGEDPTRIIKSAIFPAESRDMIIVKDIEIYSLCEHHLLPFYGRCHIGYVPAGRVVGVSKLARLADAYARRLQQQERLTHQIASALMETLKPIGVGVVIEARHLCMMMRGVEKQNSSMVTSAMLGHFRSSIATRSEFLQLIGRPPPS
ncbi:MAG TPA: GTP cyclohydrolase I FolE [Lentisphaerae bacterium]|nr:GTP cyclohydrolase I FolE [Lentisphaerota bacterium]